MAGNEDSDIVFSLDLALSDWNKSLRKVDSDLDTLEKDLNHLTNTMNSAGGTIDVSVAVDATRIGPVQQEINNLGADQNVIVTANTEGLTTAQSAVAGLGEDQDVIVTASTEGLSTAQSAVEDLGTDQTVTVDAKTSNVDTAVQTITTQLETLKALATIDILLNLPTNIPDISSIPILGAVADLEKQVDRVGAETGRNIPQAAGAITNLYGEAWSDSREQIADLIIELGRLGIANDQLESTARSVFQTAAVTGEEPVAVLNAMSQLITNEIVPNFDAAGGFLVKGFQEGLATSGDYLDSVSEYSKTLKDSNLSAGAFFTILDQGLEAGSQNTDKLIDGFKEFLNLSREETAIQVSSGDQTDRTKAIRALELTDEAEAYTAGQITGDQFSAGVLDGLRAIEDPARQRELALAIFSPTMIEEIGLPQLLAIDLSNAGELPAAWEGVAAAGAAALTDNLEGALTEFKALVETELVTAIDDAFDLQGRLDLAKQQFQDFIAAIRSGEDLGSAIEIAFGIEGTSEFLERFQSIIGNLEIVFLQAVKGIAELVPGDQGEAAIGTEIKRLSENQLAYDLQITNIEDIPGVLQTAVSRGLTAPEIGEGMLTAIDEALAAGDLELAARLSQILQQGADEPIVIRGIEFAPGTTPDQIKQRIPGGVNPAELDAEIARTFALRSEGAIPEVRERMAEVGALAREAYETALAEGRVGDARGLAESLDDPELVNRVNIRAIEMRQAAEAAFEGMDFPVFNELANKIEDPELLAKAQAWAEALRQQFDTSIASGDAGVAQTIATQLGDPSLQAQVDALTLKLSEITSLSDMAGGTIATGVDSGTTAMDTFGQKTDEVMGNAESGTRDAGFAVSEVMTTIASGLGLNIDEWDTWQLSVIEFINLVAERLIYVQEVLGGMVADASGFTAAEGTTGTTTTTTTDKPAAEGGTRRGTFLTGERGPELVSTDERVAVLNNQTSRSIFSFLEGLSGGMMGRPAVTNQRNPTLNQTNYIQSSAQLVNQQQRDADYLRTGV